MAYLWLYSMTVIAYLSDPIRKPESLEEQLFSPKEARG
jgi:hypothetical protein